MTREMEWLTGVFELVLANLADNSAGLGIIVYRPPLDLPVVPLNSADCGQVQLPTGVERTAEFLVRLSHATDPMHDGFHLVDAERLVITHICQYVAPPIRQSGTLSMPTHPVGARYMTALLASALPSVVVAATLSSQRSVVAFRGGVAEPFELNVA
jgi:hypothetical protein